MVRTLVHNTTRSHVSTPLNHQPFRNLKFSTLHPHHRTLPNHTHHFPPKSHHFHLTNPNPNPQFNPNPNSSDSNSSDSIKLLVDFKSQYNHIRVLEIPRSESHPLRGSRLLLLDSPGNIHSINCRDRILTGCYFDVFATIGAISGAGSVAILGFGAGSAAKSILELYPDVVVHGWEIDSDVIDVGREFFELSRIEREYEGRVFVHVGDALRAGNVEGGFSGVLVDLFSKGRLVPELQDCVTWKKVKGMLRDGGRVMVNVGGSCVEAEESGIDGKRLMEETLSAMSKVFGDEIYVLSLGNGKDDSSIALTGNLLDPDAWKEALYPPLGGYVHMWKPFKG